MLTRFLARRRLARANVILDNLRPALRALVTDNLALIPDYAMASGIDDRVYDALAHAIEHALGHNPELRTARDVLLVWAARAVRNARTAADSLPGAEYVAASRFKAFAQDLMTLAIDRTRCV